MSSRAIILVVDDLASNRDTLKEFLEGQDFQIIEAKDGQTALKLAADTPPDLVLLDVMMPGMDGFEVCRRLRGDSRLAEVPVIMVTALDDQASRLSGLKAGADDFITKPYNRADLRARARTITRLNHYRRLHEAHAAQRESERHFRELFETGPVATYTCDAGGTIRDFNRRAAELWGWEPKTSEAYPQYCGSFRLYHSDGRSMPHNESPMARVLTGKVAVARDTELVIGRPDGSRVSAIVSTLPLYNDAGHVSGAISCFHDINDRKAAEAELRDNAQWLRTLYEKAAVGMLETGATEGNFVRFNQRFCEFLGYRREEFALLSHAEITHKDDLAPEIENFESMRRGRLKEFTRDKRYIRKDGSVAWASVAVSCIGPQGGPASAFLTVLLDTSRRGHTDETVHQAPSVVPAGEPPRRRIESPGSRV